MEDSASFSNSENSSFSSSSSSSKKTTTTITNNNSNSPSPSSIVCWDKISSALNSIYGLQKRKKDWFTPAVYMDLYSTIFNHCSSNSFSSNSEINGGDLYALLEEHLTTSIFPYFLEKISKSPLKYLDNWKRFLESSAKVEAIFHYLDRYWVTGSTSTSAPLSATTTSTTTTKKRHIYPLLLEGWFEEVLQRLPTLPEQVTEDFFYALIELAYIPKGSLLLKNLPKTNRFIYKDRESPFISFVRREYLPMHLESPPPITYENLADLLTYCMETFENFKNLLPQMERVEMEEEIVGGEQVVKDWIVERIVEPSFECIIAQKSSITEYSVFLPLLSLKEGIFSCSEWLSLIQKGFWDDLNLLKGKDLCVRMIQKPFILYSDIISTFDGFEVQKMNMDVIESSIALFFKKEDAKKMQSLPSKICDWLTAIEEEEVNSAIIRLLIVLLKFLNSINLKESFKEQYSLSLSRRLLLLEFSYKKENLIIDTLNSIYGRAYTTPLSRMLKDINLGSEVQLLTIGPWPFGRKDGSGSGGGGGGERQHQLPHHQTSLLQRDPSNFPLKIKNELLKYQHMFHLNNVNSAANSSGGGAKKVLFWSPLLSWTVVAVPLNNNRSVGVKMNVLQFEILLYVEKMKKCTFADICSCFNNQYATDTTFAIEEGLRKMVQCSLLLCSDNSSFVLGTPSTLPKSIIPFSMCVLFSSTNGNLDFKSPTLNVNNSNMNSNNNQLSKEAQVHSVQALLVSFLKNNQDTADENHSTTTIHKALMSKVKKNSLYPNFTIDKEVFASAVEALVTKGYVELIIIDADKFLKYIP